MTKYKYGSKSEARLRNLYPFLQLVMLRPDVRQAILDATDMADLQRRLG